MDAALHGILAFAQANDKRQANTKSFCVIADRWRLVVDGGLRLESIPEGIRES
jgi:hypothetical protein